MTPNKNKIKLLVLIFSVFIVLISIIVKTTETNSSQKAQPHAVDGILDLTNWDFTKDGNINLNGQWLYYDNNLLSPKELETNSFKGSVSDIPGIYSKQGFGTYRLKVLLKNKNDLYSIKIEFVQSAYKLWADDKLIASVGQVGDNRLNMTPQLLPKAGSFFDKEGVVYLTLEVSNYYAKYGMVDTLVMGSAQTIDKLDAYKLSFDLFLFGCTLIAAIYNLGLYMKRKKDKSTLYFAIVCLIVGVRTLFLGQRFIILVFPNFSYFISGKVMHWTYYLYVPFIVLYISSFYKNIVSSKIIAFAKYSAYLYAIAVLISPWKYYMDLILPIEAVTVILLSYLILILSKAYIKKGGSSYIVIAALFSLLLTRINDLLYEYSIFITGSFAPIGTLIFIIASSYTLAERQSLALSHVEDMSDKLNSLNNLKDEFLAVTSHELKTPLNGIIGLSESLNSGINSLSLEERHSLSLINVSAKRLTNLVDDIMVFSKLKHGDIKLNKRVVNISKVVDMVVRVCEVSIKSKNIKLINLVDDKAPKIIADEGRLQQILYNLIGNAVKFTSRGSVTIEYKQNNNYLEVSISDTGIGIPKERLHSIFDFFEQVDGISEKYGGTGLGLYITKKLVDLHNGYISVESVIKEGSKFIFSMPIASASYSLIVDHNETIVETAKSSEKLETISNDESDNTYVQNSFNLEKALINKSSKILIVDDEYVNQKVLESYLKSTNIQVLKASSGQDALKAVQENDDLDLVILDMMMPDLLGFEVCSFIRNKYSIFEVPVLIMTADNRVENLVLAFECGANDYLAKPCNKNELLARVRTLLTLKHSVKDALNLTYEISEAREQVKSLNEQNIESTRKVQELMEYDKLKTEFFTNLSHELRTPLNVICSTIQLLGSIDGERTLGEERIKYYLSIMNQNSLRLLRLVNNLIDITKIDGGYMTLNLKEDNIIYSVEGLVQSVAEYMHSLNIEIVFDTEVEEKYMAFDEEKLERIILNILSNAVKFTDKGGSINVNIYDKEAFVEITVKDTGIGIPQDKLDFIFERFAQVDKSLNRRSEGSGIGLSLVKALVELHKGKITVRSKIGEGTEFIITLPANRLSSEDLSKNISLKEVSESKYEKSLSVEFSDIYI